MPKVGSGNGVANIRIHRQSLEGVNSLNQIPNVKSIYIQHDNGFYKYRVKKIVIDPVDSDAFYLTVKQEHNTIPTGSASSALVFTPYIAGKFKNSDFDSLLSNATEGQTSLKYQIVDNGGSQLQPTNLSAINNRAAGFAQIQDSNYEIESYTRPRYDGTKHTANNFNLESSTGLVPVSDTHAYFAYFNWIGGTSPDIQRKTGASIKYMIDLEGNTISPTNDEVALSIVQQNFAAGSEVVISLEDVDFAGNNMAGLEGDTTVLAGGKRIENIISTLDSTDGSYYYAVTASNLYFTNAETGVHVNIAHNGWTQGSNLNSLTQSFASTVISSEHIFLGVSGTDITATEQTNNGSATTYLPASPGGTGYQTPSLPFTINQYDTLVILAKQNFYRTTQITNVRLVGSTYYIELDSEVDISLFEPKGYSIYRLEDAAGTVLLNRNKPGGATSGGILKPKYMPAGSEKKIRDIIDDLKQKGII